MTVHSGCQSCHNLQVCLFPSFQSSLQLQVQIKCKWEKLATRLPKQHSTSRGRPQMVQSSSHISRYPWYVLSTTQAGLTRKRLCDCFLRTTSCPEKVLPDTFWGWQKQYRERANKLSWKGSSRDLLGMTNAMHALSAYIWFLASFSHQVDAYHMWKFSQHVCFTQSLHIFASLLLFWLKSFKLRVSLSETQVINHLGYRSWYCEMFI